MSHQPSSQAPGSNKESLQSALDGLLPDQDILEQVPRHGNTKWLPTALVRLALLWSFSEQDNLTSAYDDALKDCQRLGHDQIPKTYQGFLGALLTHSKTLVALLCRWLRSSMKSIAGDHFRTHGWTTIAFDGSRTTAPRTVSNERAFCAPNHGNGKTAKYRKKKTKNQRRKNNKNNPPAPPAPQAWLTMMWHVGSRLPWCWRLGPSNSSERAHVQEMIQNEDFPEKTLFVGDAGFVGYPLWKTVLDAGHHFLVRVGGNVTLLASNADYQRHKDGIVYCWPKGQRNSGEAPLCLRLLTVGKGKKKKMFLLTSVLDSRQLSRTQAHELYRQRWGIEVEFRGLKQTLSRVKLRCREASRVYVELDWAILGMALAELLALQAQLPSSPPERRSLAQTMEALRKCRRYLLEVPDPGEDLQSQLSMAIIDDYQRSSSKEARYRKPNPDKKPLGVPKVEKLTPQEKRTMLQGTTKKAA